MVGYVIRDSDGRCGVCRARNSGVSTECFSGRDDWLYTGIAGSYKRGDHQSYSGDRCYVGATSSQSWRLQLLEELDSLVSSNFNSFVCLAIPRDCNKVAHELAILGCACAEESEPVLSSLPDHVNTLIADEQLASF